MVAELLRRPPRADFTPVTPPGIVTVTCVNWWYAAVGRNCSVLVPVPCQLPAMRGLIVGSGEPAAIGAENWILMAGTPFTPRVSLAGVSETSWSGAAVADGWPVPPGLEFSPVADDCADACV